MTKQTRKRIWLAIGILIYAGIIVLLPLLLFVRCTLNLTRKLDKMQEDVPPLAKMPQEQRYAIAENYIRAKYHAECEAFWDNNSYLDWSAPRGQQLFDPVALRPKGDPEGESLKDRAGQSLLDNCNQSVGKDITPCFFVYLDYDGQVLGDQYMCYNIYPLLEEQMHRLIEDSAPCGRFILNMNCMKFGKMGIKDFSFSVDCPPVSTYAETEDILSDIRMFPDLIVAESEIKQWITADWQPLKQEMSAYEFEQFRITVYTYPDADFEKWLHPEKMTIGDRLGYFTKPPESEKWLMLEPTKE